MGDFHPRLYDDGRVAVLSDQPGEEWMHDYRFLEAVR